MPSREGGELKAADIFGYMFPSNCPAKYVDCASVITLRTPSLRQSAAGKSRLSETQISILVPTARRVNCSK